MVKKILTILFCAFSLLMSAQNDNFTKANKAFYQKDYDTAISGYEALVKDGLQSFELFYNLGTSYAKKGQVGKAILYFEKAKLLEPNNPMLENNLSIVQGQIKDDIDTINPFFLKDWWETIYRMFSSSVWSILTLLFLWLGVFGVSKWILSPERKKYLFYAIPLFILGLISFFGARSKANFEINSQMGVVLAQEAVLKSGADNSSDDILTIHEGLKLTLEDKIGDWYKVRLANGEIGWLPNDVVGKI